MNDAIPDFGQEPSTELIDNIKDMIGLRDSLNRLNAEVDDYKRRIQTLEAKCFAQMESIGIQNVTININGRARTAHTRVDVYMSMNPANKEQAEHWLKENGWADLFKETINSRTMTGALKEFQNEGGEIPTELINQKVVNRVGTPRR